MTHAHVHVHVHVHVHAYLDNHLDLLSLITYARTASMCDMETARLKRRSAGDPTRRAVPNNMCMLHVYMYCAPVLRVGEMSPDGAHHGFHE